MDKIIASVGEGFGRWKEDSIGRCTSGGGLGLEVKRGLRRD